jgi:hypothetical protein
MKLDVNKNVGFGVCEMTFKRLRNGQNLSTTIDPFL